MNLLVGSEYNLNVLKEIAVTDSFLTLDVDDRHCQNDETYDECKTRNYMNTLVNKCKCLPFQLKLTDDKVPIWQNEL